MARGQLRVYLGAAPGVGKTYAMLNEGRRANVRGTDVVVGFVETHGRTHTAEQVGELEVVPRKSIAYRNTQFEEMDTEAIIAELEQERDRLDRAIQALQAGRLGRRRRRRRLSAAARQRISAGMKRRWAKRKRKAG